MIKSVVIVGGGTAGWLTAGIIAARHVSDHPDAIKITLIESPDIPTIGVGEGTWPSMVNTLMALGISEHDFIKKCNVSLKQGICFEGWRSGTDEDYYYHPFGYPHASQLDEMLATWLKTPNEKSFVDTVNTQAQLAEKFLAPKPMNAQDYSSYENYGYHLDARCFADFLRLHCVEKLGVKLISDNVICAYHDHSGNIQSLGTIHHGELLGDLFIDCSGMNSVLIEKQFNVPYKCCKSMLFADSAVAAQVPYATSNTPIFSMTRSVAKQAGWIWDIGLQSRRGVGYVYAGTYQSDADAEEVLLQFIGHKTAEQQDIKLNKIKFNPGHRQKFWLNNCVAVGMSAGFIEPLEASALGMIELSARMIAEQLPVSQSAMAVVAKKFNEVFLKRWELIIDFLKLHYCISERRDSKFWIDNRNPETISDTLYELLELWKEQPPMHNGILDPYDMFPVASYQYVLYGMGFQTKPSHLKSSSREIKRAHQNIATLERRKEKLIRALPTNRDFVNAIVGK